MSIARLSWLVLPATLLLGACGDDTPRPRNVLLISVDTLRADALGVAGHPAARTPNVDRLAAEGTYFTQAIAPIPRTTPALGSLLTGTEPRRHGSREVGDAISGVRTLAELLGDRGFATLAVSANDSAGPKQGLARGFDHFVTYRDLIDTYGDDLYRDLTDVPADRDGWAAVTTREALDLIDRAPGDRPFFLWLFYFDPHFLYRPPAPWQDGVAAEGCWQLYREWQQRRSEAGQVFADVGGVSSRVLDDCRRLYDAEVAYTDHEISRLLDELGRRGRLNGTLVVFTADHGENFGEGGLFFEHGDNAHDAGLRVPLIFRGPGIASGRRDDGGVGLADVVPTVLSLLGVPRTAWPPLDGHDLSPRLDASSSPDPRARKRILFAESAGALWNEATARLVTGNTWWRICINGPRYSLCEIPKKAPGVFTLYDHVEDPALSRDVAAAHPEVVAGLREAWKRWPPESARERVARTPELKLVQRPQLDGTWTTALYHLPSDPEESIDVSGRYPEAYRVLRAALEGWAAELPELGERSEDAELAQSLRSLGYLP